MILLLIAVGVLYSFLGNLTDAATIISIIVILVLAEVWNEYRAKRSIAALNQLAPPTAIVLRDGQPVEIQIAGQGRGDILLLKVGQRVPADARIIESYGFEVDESSLTGINPSRQRRLRSDATRSQSHRTNQHGLHGNCSHSG